MATSTIVTLTVCNVCASVVEFGNDSSMDSYYGPQYMARVRAALARHAGNSQFLLQAGRDVDTSVEFCDSCGLALLGEGTEVHKVPMSF